MAKEIEHVEVNFALEPDSDRLAITMSNGNALLVSVQSRREIVEMLGGVLTKDLEQA